MAYEYYKTNHKKLTKVERHSNKEYQKRFYEEAHQKGLEMIKTSMYKRLADYEREKEND